MEVIAAASPRLVSLVFGPADFVASIGMRSLTVGGQPAGYDFEAHHYPLMRMLVAARANGLRKAPAGVAALGCDGKWVLHPAQVPVVNEAFTPRLRSTGGRWPSWRPTTARRGSTGAAAGLPGPPGSPESPRPPEPAP